MSRDRAAGTDQTRSQERGSYALPRGVHRFPEKELGVCWIDSYHNLHSFSIHQFTHLFVRLFIFIFSPSTHPLLSQASRFWDAFVMAMPSFHGHACRQLGRIQVYHRRSLGLRRTAKIRGKPSEFREEDALSVWHISGVPTQNHKGQRVSNGGDRQYVESCR